MSFPSAGREKQKKESVGERSSDIVDLWSDGASRGNPGPAGIGVLAKDSSGREVLRLSEYLGETTNNVAEYYALISALEELSEMGYRRVRVNSDSELLVRQLSGIFKVKSRKLMPLVGKVKQILAAYDDVELNHINRSENVECDRLANEAIDEGLAGVKKPILTEGEASLF